jgi:PAS domain S-box-containing protein
MWLELAWPMIAAACLTLAAIHTHVWLRERTLVANAAFALLCANVAWLAFCELEMLTAATVEAYLDALWWLQMPAFFGVVAIVVFVRQHMRAGRSWLAALVIGARGATLLLNFALPGGVNWLQADGLGSTRLLGQPVALLVGTPNPAVVVAHLSLLLLLLVFVLDAALTTWRRGEHRVAVTIGGSLVLFVTMASVGTIVNHWVRPFPFLVTLYFVPIVLAMGFELSVQLLRSAQLSEDLSRKELQLRSSEQTLQLAADAAGAGLWSVDQDTGRLWATPRALEMFDLKPGHEHHIADVLRSIHPEDLPAVRPFLQGGPGGRTTDASSSIDYRVRRADGALRWYASRGSRQERGPRALQGLMGVTIDITERKQAEEETARQRMALEHMSRVAMLPELSGALAHELNQPLAIIMSNAEAAQLLLQQDEPDLAEIRAILQDIVAADERAGEVILRLRQMLKRGHARREMQSLNLVVQGVLKFMRGDLVRRGVTVKLDLAPDLPGVAVDRVPMEQVLINLINNGCDAMAGNSPSERQLAIHTRCADGLVELAIADRGSGLPETPARVFEPFYTTKPEGLGMGLPISRSIVVAHGGVLEASNNDGRGATFVLRLPLSRPATVGQPATAATA